MNANDYIEAIRSGNVTRQDIADDLGLAASTVGHNLRELQDDGVVDRERAGRAYEWFVVDDRQADDEADEDENWNDAAAAQTADTTTSMDTADSPTLPEMGQVPETAPEVDRDYDWTQFIPDEGDVHEYIPSDTEWDEISAKIDTRQMTGQEVNVMLGGPTGCGKTTLAEYKAAQDGVPLITIQMTYDMTPASLKGKAVVKGDGAGGTSTLWNDGDLTKALLASRAATRDDTDFDYAMVLIDEANRARPEVHSTLMSALDSRCEIKLDKRGGEKVRGVRENLVAISTINPTDEGDYHGTQELDFAVKRRLTNAGRYDVDYLGINYPNREADVISQRTPAGTKLADRLVETANQVRETADDATSTNNVKAGIPTSTLISWAQSAAAFAQTGIDNPVVTAAENDVVKALYDGDAATEVEQIISDNLDGCPFDDEDIAAWAGEVDHVSCDNCGYRETADVYEQTDAADYIECPDCSSHVTYE